MPGASHSTLGRVARAARTWLATAVEQTAA